MPLFLTPPAADARAAGGVSTPAVAPADGLPQPQRGRAMMVILLGIAISVLDGTIMNLALPSIAQELQASAAKSIWVVNAYQIASLVLLLPLANLGDRVGYRRVYLWGVALFGLASLGAALAPTMDALIAARALEGVGAAGIMSVNAALVRQTYPRALLGRGLALNSMTVAVASVAGPSLAAAILSVVSWPWLFGLNVPLSLLLLVLGRLALPDCPPSVAGGRISALDVALNILMFGLIFVGADRLGVRQGGAAPGGALDAWVMLLAGLGVGVVYLRRQSRRVAPLFPVDLLRIPVFALSMGTSVTAFAAQMLAYIAVPFLLLDVYGRTHLQAGLLITAWPVAIVAMGPIVGRLIGRVPAGLLGGLGQGLMALGLAAMAALPAQPSDIDIVWRMALCGLGFGLFQSPNNHTIVTSAPPQRAGAASGMLGTARLTGQTLGAVILAGIFSLWHPQDGLGPVIALGLAAGFAVLSGLCSLLRVRAPRTGAGPALRP